METTNNEFQSVLIPRQETEVIQELVNCALACEACSSACLHEKDYKSHNRIIELTRDCSEFCFQTARFVMRKSEIAEQYLSMAEEICRVCADECKKYQMDYCDVCAEACEECASTCNNYQVELSAGNRN